MVREIIGNVICVNVCHVPAPSTFEASYTFVSTLANAEDIIIIMNGKLIHTLNTHTVICANVGSARNNTFPNPNA
ncbi:hypothetical protein GCM10027568_36310 [Humibacter soli]